MENEIVEESRLYLGSGTIDNLKTCSQAVSSSPRQGNANVIRGIS